MFYWLLKYIFLGPFIRLFLIKKVDGLENIPKKGPVIIAVNHSSYLDFFSLAAVIPRRIYFIAAEKFFESKLWFPLMLLTRQTKVDRNGEDKNETIKKINEILHDGKVFCIFPEGTRSRDGKIQRAYTGVIKIGKTNKTAIVPIAIKGAYELLPPQNKLIKVKKKIEIRILKPIKYNDFAEKKNEDATQSLMQVISAEIGQKYKW